MVRRSSEIESSEGTTDKGGEFVGEEMSTTVREYRLGSGEDGKPAVEKDIHRGLGIANLSVPSS